MTGLSQGTNLIIAHRFPWAGYNSFIDIGSAQGDLAIQIALTNPHLQGRGFDLQEVAPIFEECAADAGVTSRLRFQGGDFFKQDLPKADVVPMGHILHGWDLSTKNSLIKKA
jgi:methylase of polypeptide subunit release factors